MQDANYGTSSSIKVKRFSVDGDLFEPILFKYDIRGLDASDTEGIILSLTDVIKMCSERISELVHVKED